MKILVVTGRFGMGHVSAAEAVKEELERTPGVSVTVVDLMQYLFPVGAGLIYSGFSKVSSRCSVLYNAVNRIDENRSRIFLKSSFFKRFDRLIRETEPDLIISTLPVVSKYIGAYLKETGNPIRYIVCITDIAPHSEWISEKVGAYMVGDEMTRGLLIRKGVEPDKIIIGGIPVRQEFHESGMDRQEVHNHKEVLIMGGGLGLIPGVDRIIDELTKVSGVHVTVITGKNETLKATLQRNHKDAEILGYTDQVADYMKRADLLISKAGGITVFEAIYSQTPVLALQPFLEQEKKNAELIQRKNIGMILEFGEQDSEEQLRHMLFDRNLLYTMRENMKTLKASYKAGSISEIVCRI